MRYSKAISGSSTSRYRYVSFWGAGVIFLVLILLTALKPSGAMDQDLGRHLKLGEIIVETGQVPATNLFSYTHPGFPFVNHHWLSEVVFFLISRAYGIGGIVVLKFILLALVYGAAFYSAYRLSGAAPALTAGLLFFFFAGERTDERPELFGFVLFSLLFYLLFAIRVRKRFLYPAVAVIMALWINLHVSFAFGLLLIGIYAAHEVWESFRARMPLRAHLQPFVLIAVAFGALFLNPHGLRGALYPFLMFGNYGYRIVENQSLFFLLPRIANPLIIPFFFVAGGVLLLLVASSILQKRVPFFCFAWGACAAATLFMIRTMPFFVLSGIPVAAYAFRVLGEHGVKKFRAWSGVALPALCVLGLMLAVGLVATRSLAYSLSESGRRGVDFLLAHRLPQNIFNNFDIGGYLDYRLWPSYYIFVDNRPEAFPKEFFDEYIRIQEDPVFRKEAFRRYSIRTVVFGRNDATPWAQRFLAQITRDPEWRLAYADDFLVIFTEI